MANARICGSYLLDRQHHSDGRPRSHCLTWLATLKIVRSYSSKENKGLTSVAAIHGPTGAAILSLPLTKDAFVQLALHAINKVCQHPK